MTDDSSVGLALDLQSAAWRKSSFSTDGECFSVAVVGPMTAVRNSNSPKAGTLKIPSATMAVWVAGIKAGEFDDLGA